MIDPEDVIFGQWQYIYDILTNELNFGGSPTPVPGGGTNPTGKLQQVASTGLTAWPDFQNLPYVGVQLESVEEQPYAARRKHEFKTNFSIITVVNIEASGDNILKVDDAMSLLRKLQSDGTGNGVLPILRSDANFNLGTRSDGGPNAEENRISKVTYQWDQAPIGKGTQFIAYATTTLLATIRLTVGGV